MKRDLDLIRKLIIAVEGRPSEAPLGKEVADGYTPEQIGYHNYLLVDAAKKKGARRRP